MALGEINRVAVSSLGPLVFLFNGDADGLIAQRILEMHLGAPDLRITGLKRDIKLLQKLPPMEAGHIHALDISLRQNQPELLTILAKENLNVTWYDHHDPGEVEPHPRLHLHIYQSSGTCSAVIVNAVFGRQQGLWAAMAAFGDAVPDTAKALIDEVGVSHAESNLLQRSGILLNYNAYGEKISDVLFDPADLAKRMSQFTSALDFCQEESIFGPLTQQFVSDQSMCKNLTALNDSEAAQAYLAPDAPWARRYLATWANEHILDHPLQALALIHPRAGGDFQVSIRAPRGTPGVVPSAASLASEFTTGGGRKLAAGINVLPAHDLERFVKRFERFFAGGH